MDLTFIFPINIFSRFRSGGYLLNIYQIAERSGVSIATVSRVINGSSKVSPKTREKVLKIIDEENYKPNAFARGLGLNSMKIIGILCTDVADLYYAKAVSILQQNLRNMGFDTLLSGTGDEMQQKKKSLELMLEKRVDAVILVGSALQELKDNTHIREAAKKVPLAIINGYVDMDNVLCVLCSEKECVKENVIRLHKQSFTKILYLYDVMTYSAMQKQEGYKKGHEKCQMLVNNNLIIKTTNSIGDVRNHVKQLMDSGLEFDSIMTSEDSLAVGAQKALNDKKISMPVIGFNNSVLAQSATPTITSVDNMLESLCETAVSLLLDHLSNKKVPHKIIVSGRLIERETFKTI